MVDRGLERTGTRRTFASARVTHPLSLVPLPMSSVVGVAGSRLPQRFRAAGVRVQITIVPHILLPTASGANSVGTEAMLE